MSTHDQPESVEQLIERLSARGPSRGRFAISRIRRLAARTHLARVLRQQLGRVR